MTPRFLEFAVSTDDVVESLTFYKRLGFTEVSTSDAIDYPYAVVTDGTIAVGLHARAEQPLALRFVRENVRRFVLDQSERGVEFSDVALDDDALHRASLDGPSGVRVSWIEARTFSPSGAETPRSLCGTFLDVTLPVADLYAAARFWAPYSSRVVAEKADPPAMRFESFGIAVAIAEYPRTIGPTLSFRIADAAALQSTLDRFDIELGTVSELPGSPGDIRAPEGTRLTLWRDDPLGTV